MRNYAWLIIAAALAALIYYMVKVKAAMGAGDGAEAAGSQAAASAKEWEIQIGAGLKETVSPFDACNFAKVPATEWPTVDLNCESPLDIVDETTDFVTSSDYYGYLEGVILVTGYTLPEGGILKIIQKNIDDGSEYDSFSIKIPKPDVEWSHYNVWMGILNAIGKDTNFIAEVYWNKKLVAAHNFALTGITPGRIGKAAGSATLKWLALGVGVVVLAAAVKGK